MSICFPVLHLVALLRKLNKDFKSIWEIQIKMFIMNCDFSVVDYKNYKQLKSYVFEYKMRYWIFENTAWVVLMIYITVNYISYLLSWRHERKVLLTKMRTQEKSSLSESSVALLLSNISISSFLQQSTCNTTIKSISSNHSKSNRYGVLTLKTYLMLDDGRKGSEAGDKGKRFLLQ